MINGDVVSHLNVSQARTKYGGTYECRASSKVGVVSHSAKLNVLGAPFVKRMRPAKVRCIYSVMELKVMSDDDVYCHSLNQRCNSLNPKCFRW